MIISNLLISVVATLTLLVVYLRFGWNSCVGIGISVAYLYSVPAMIGLYLPIHLTLGTPGYFASPSTEAVLSLFPAWVVFVGMALVLPTKSEFRQFKNWSVENYLKSCVLISIIGYTIISIKIGPLFFLKNRADTTLGLVSTMWRWSIVFGLICSVVERSRPFQIYFLILLLMYSIAGDRTIAAISIAAILAVPFFKSGQRVPFPTVPELLSLIFIFPVVLIWKNVYSLIKNPNFENAVHLFSYEQLIGAVKSFEPFGTFSLFQMTIDQNIKIGFDDFLNSIFSNILIIPSLFNIQSNYSNQVLVDQLPGGLSFGIAGNFFAHGYSVFDIFGVPIFAFLLFLALYVLERIAIRCSGFGCLSCIVLSVSIGVVSQRNGFDNTVAFVRQIGLMALAVVFLSNLIKSFNSSLVSFGVSSVPKSKFMPHFK